ncbi:hypothetical protein THAOC_27601 [Thalassiosira oceanica]|uniref:Uncharacterized protein n=1 Tax=Thalassiosira oceanica TaxID=159749 RepID=K0RW14_THAOC|nr:hypothetical protein THAOC_27601 [Thalassiosira oceanica]|eukprot:EJK53031.1 hypothetical protein THAOC_27601 [Thalassiosira oceanica]
MVMMMKMRMTMTMTMMKMRTTMKKMRTTMTTIKAWHLPGRKLMGKGEDYRVVGSLMTLQKGSDVLRPLLHSLQQRCCVHKLAEDPNRNHNSYKAPP